MKRAHAIKLSGSGAPNPAPVQRTSLSPQNPAQHYLGLGRAQIYKFVTSKKFQPHGHKAAPQLPALHSAFGFLALNFKYLPQNFPILPTIYGPYGRAVGMQNPAAGQTNSQAQPTIKQMRFKMKRTLVALSLMALSSTAFAVEELDFAKLDLNADGALSLTEIQVAMPELSEEAFNAADADKSGTLSMEEIAALSDDGMTKKMDNKNMDK
jgi:hypothetical protein